MLKNRIALLLAALLLLSAFAGCGGKAKENKNNGLQADNTVAPTSARVESLDQKYRQQFFGDDVIYDYYTFEDVDSESIAITGFCSQTLGKNAEANTDSDSYVLCLKAHVVVVPQTLLGKTVVQIKDGAFRQHNEISALVLPKTLTSIGQYAFEECSYLEGVNIPATVTEIGQSAFYRCTGMKTLTFAEQSELSVIRQSTFMGCTSLTEVHIPGYIKTIEKAAFLNCSALSSLTFEEGLETIGDQAFQNLNLAETPALPSTIQSVGEWNFQ